MTLLSIHDIVVATRNWGKLREFRELLAPAGLMVRGLGDLGITEEVDETGAAFAENARLKALAYSGKTDLPVLADDSGLEVFALGGRPGIASARYAGPGASDADRIAKLLGELDGSAAAREARFVCALALAQNGEILLEAEGECRGVIGKEARGTNGFGYDPIFVLQSKDQTMAELDEQEKNEISHRARAVLRLLQLLKSAG